MVIIFALLRTQPHATTRVSEYINPGRNLDIGRWSCSVRKEIVGYYLLSRAVKPAGRNVIFGSFNTRPEEDGEGGG